MSLRAPWTSVALPMNTGPGGSPATGSRNTRTPETSTSSSAQPVTATDPVIPAVPFTGVSSEPNGAADTVPLTTLSRTLIVSVSALPAPVSAIVTTPVCVATRPAANRTSTVRTADPFPFGGATVSHG